MTVANRQARVNGFPDSLLDGYRSFRGSRYEPERARYRALAEHGQTPEAMVIACCDSRSAPETIFHAAPGELFVVRNVANLRTFPCVAILGDRGRPYLHGAWFDIAGGELWTVNPATGDSVRAE